MSPLPDPARALSRPGSRAPFGSTEAWDCKRSQAPERSLQNGTVSAPETHVSGHSEAECQPRGTSPGTSPTVPPPRGDRWGPMREIPPRTKSGGAGYDERRGPPCQAGACRMTYPPRCTTPGGAGTPSPVPAPRGRCSSGPPPYPFPGRAHPRAWRHAWRSSSTYRRIDHAALSRPPAHPAAHERRALGGLAAFTSAQGAGVAGLVSTTCPRPSAPGLTRHDAEPTWLRAVRGGSPGASRKPQ